MTQHVMVTRKLSDTFKMPDSVSTLRVITANDLMSGEYDEFFQEEERMKTLRMAVMLVLLTFAAQAVFAQSESECNIKGIIGQEGKKFYLMPGHKLYEKIQVRADSGEQLFCTAQESQSDEEAVTEQQPPVETPQEEQPPAEASQAEQAPADASQEEQPVETPAETVSESQPVDISPTDQEMPPFPIEGLGLLMGMLVPLLIFIGVFALIMLIAMWKIFSKAGKPGWACIVPIYSNIVLLDIAGMPLWWFIGYLIPPVSPIVWLINCLKLAERFGKGAGYGLGLFFLPFIFFPLLAFSSAEYSG